MSEFDYIIVGAGSAGCVLANRLTEDGAHSVLLIEAGKDDRSLFIRMPTALSIPMSTPRFNWGYWGAAEPGLEGRKMDCARGTTGSQLLKWLILLMYSGLLGLDTLYISIPVVEPIKSKSLSWKSVSAWVRVSNFAKRVGR